MRILGSDKVCKRVDLVDVALGTKSADLVINGGRLVNVHTGEIYKADVALSGGRIAAVGDVAYTIGEETKTINAEGKYLTPGLIDTHLHFYHSYLGLTEFAKAILLHGTTTYVDALYGPAIVSGMRALKFLRQELLKTPLKCIFLAPVVAYSQNRSLGLPPTPYSITAKELEEIINWPDCLGLEEPQPSYVLAKEGAHIAIYEFALDRGKLITGHGSALSMKRVNAYIAMGTITDHECVTAEDAVEKARLGMKILARYAPGIPDVATLVKAITEYHIDPRCFCFNADALPPDALEAGDVDECIRVAIAGGINPIDAVQMATLNAAELFRVDEEIGSITPGRIADILFVTNLPKFKISMVMANGEIVAKDGEFLIAINKPKYPDWMYETVRLKRPVKPEDFEIKAPSRKDEVAARIIYYPADSSAITTERIVRLNVKNRYVQPNIDEDIIKIAMVDRYNGETGEIGNGFVQGFGLREGAFGLTVNSVCENILVTGTNSNDMSFVTNKLAQIGGGMVAVANMKIRAVVELPLFGLLSDDPLETFLKKVRKLAQVLREMGWKHASPSTLEFAGPPGDIPYLKISALGLVDIEKRKIIDVLIKPNETLEKLT